MKWIDIRNMGDYKQTTMGDIFHLYDRPDFYLKVGKRKFFHIIRKPQTLLGQFLQLFGYYEFPENN